jgi:MarR family transcriptional regulator, transcriptional regulator for hemolysin
VSARKSPGRRECGAPRADGKLIVRPPLEDCEGPACDDIRLGFLIHDVSRMRRTAYDQLMKPMGVTRAQWWVLAYLSRHDGMMQTELAEALDVGKASLGSLVDRLAAAGFVERSAVPGDRRAKRVHLASPGYLLLQRMTEVETSLNERILSALSPADRGTLIRTLSAVKQALARQLGDQI